MLAALPTVFAGLTLVDSQEARALLEYIDVPVGDDVMIQGENDQTLAFIVKGHVEVWLDDVKVGTAGPRDMIGEMELFMPSPRAFTVTANAPLSLHSLNPEKFGVLCELGNPVVLQIERAALKQLRGRLRKLNDQISQSARGAPMYLNPIAPSLFARLASPFRKKKEPNVDRASVIRESELFSWAPEDITDAIAEAFTVQTYKKDDFICEQGEEADCMWIIVEGNVQVALPTDSESAEIVGMLKPGHAFGDASVALKTARTASCIARTEVVVLRMSHAKYKEIQWVDDPVGSAFRQGMIRNLVLQLQATTSRYVGIVRASSQSDVPADGSNIWR
ncbi:MAG: cyclic nucleotide-binding domain-containing protein [Rhodobacterales bacterium]|nr:cyclic nucleotide-binding domain-containing protein [Rhodobacterales bacterium]